MPSCRAHAIEFVVNYEQLRPDRLCKIGQGKEFARRGITAAQREAYRRASHRSAVCRQENGPSATAVQGEQAASVGIP